MEQGFHEFLLAAELQEGLGEADGALAILVVAEPSTRSHLGRPLQQNPLKLALEESKVVDLQKLMNVTLNNFLVLFHSPQSIRLSLDGLNLNKSTVPKAGTHSFGIYFLHLNLNFN